MWDKERPEFRSKQSRSPLESSDERLRPGWRLDEALRRPHFRSVDFRRRRRRRRKTPRRRKRRRKRSDDCSWIVCANVVVTRIR